MLPLFLALSCLAGCSTTDRPVIGATLVSNPPEAPRPIQLKINVPKAAATEALKRSFELNSEPAPAQGEALHLRLTALSIEFDVRPQGNGRCEIEIPPNALELLSKDGRPATYTGELVFEKSGTKIPMTLTFETAKSKRAKARPKAAAG